MSVTAFPDVLQEKPSQERLSYSYEYLHARWLKRFRNTIDNMRGQAGNPQAPMTRHPFEEFFTGFLFDYIPFDNTTVSDPATNKVLHGFSRHKEGEVKVLYANNCIRARQRFTIMHELMHFMQSMEPMFMLELDNLRPIELQSVLIDELADYLAAYYLVPPSQLQEQLKKTNIPIVLATHFDVSTPVIEICVKNYNLTLKKQKHGPPW